MEIKTNRNSCSYTFYLSILFLLICVDCRYFIPLNLSTSIFMTLESCCFPLIYPNSTSQIHIWHSKCGLLFFHWKCWSLSPLTFTSKSIRARRELPPEAHCLWISCDTSSLPWPRLIVADPAKCGIEGALAAATIIYRCLAIRQEHKLKLYICVNEIVVWRDYSSKTCCFDSNVPPKKGVYIYIYLRTEAQGLTCHKLIYHLFLWAGKRCRIHIYIIV